MKFRKLGAFDVSAIGLGCMSMSHAYGEPDRAKAERALHHALDIGYTFLDTAALYGFGANETLLGEVIADRRGEIVLASKCGLFRGADGKRSIDGRPDMLRQTCEDSLKRLRTDVIDLYYLHRPDPKVPLEESIGALGQLVSEGKIRAVGISEVSSATLRRAHHAYPITAIQSEYSLWTRKPETAVLDACRELGIGFVAFSPLARAFLTGTIQDADQFEKGDIRRGLPRFQGENFASNLKLLDEYGRIAGEAGCSMAQLALAWLLAQDDMIVPIPGTQHAEYAEENAGALDIVLSTEVLARLNELINDDTVMGERYPPAILAATDSETD